MDRLVSDAFVRPVRGLGGNEGGGGELPMPIDVSETGDAVTVRASLPGVKPDDIDINITGDVVTIRGETKSESESEEGNYHRREIRSGSYMRSVPLPSLVKADNAQATFENGVLTLRLPKADEVKPKQIKVQAGQPAIETGTGEGQGQQG
jgi:HSP20 family protein